MFEVHYIDQAVNCEGKTFQQHRRLNREAGKFRFLIPILQDRNQVHLADRQSSLHVNISYKFVNYFLQMLRKHSTVTCISKFDFFQPLPTSPQILLSNAAVRRVVSRPPHTSLLFMLLSSFTNETILRRKCLTVSTTAMLAVFCIVQLVK